jgi:putative zinc finger/helix-turn-helix YgiT family protein
MTHDPQPKARRSPGDRPFPWRCPRCLKKEVSPTTIAYTADVVHEGRSYKVEVPELQVPRCQACGELVFDSAADEQLLRALPAQARLLTPKQIKDARVALGLKSKDLAERLGVAAETISRWERGALIQSRAMDNLLRLYFACPPVRALLRGAEQDPDLGTTVVPDDPAPPEPPPNRIKGRFRTNVEPHRKRAADFALNYEKN